MSTAQPHSEFDPVHPVIAVTGGTGFLGSHVIRELLAQGCRVRALRRDRRKIGHLDPLEIEWVMGDLLDQDLPPQFPGDADVCIHLAALYLPAGEDDERLFAVNVEGTRKLLEACGRDGVGRFAHVSTMGTCAPASHGSLATEEDHVEVDVGISPYACSKVLSEQLALAWRGGETVAALPAAPIGAYDHAPSVTGQRLVDYRSGVMPRLLSGPINYVAAEDCARGIVRVAKSGRSGQRYLLGGENLGPGAFLNLIQKATGVPIPRRSLLDWLLGRRRFPPGSLAIDDSLARGELGYASGPLEPAIREAFEDMRARG